MVGPREGGSVVRGTDGRVTRRWATFLRKPGSRWWSPGERRGRRGARLTRRVREEYRVYFDRDATMSGGQRRGQPGWIAGRTPPGFHYRLLDPIGTLRGRWKEFAPGGIQAPQWAHSEASGCRGRPQFQQSRGRRSASRIRLRTASRSSGMGPNDASSRRSLRTLSALA